MFHEIENGIKGIICTSFPLHIMLFIIAYLQCPALVRLYLFFPSIVHVPNPR